MQVPGVKLRPAQPSKRQTKDSDEEETVSVWAEDTQLASEDVVFQNNIPKPFEGLVICSTGVQDRVRAIFLDLGTVGLAWEDDHRGEM